MSPVVYVLWIVSLVSLAIYLFAFVRLVTQSHHAGIVRTAACRVAAACMYVMIAMLATTGHPARATISIGVFVMIQLMWQINAVADVLLTRRENRARELAVRWAFDYRLHPKPRHRRK